MNKSVYWGVLLGLGLAVSQVEAKEKAPELKSDQDRISYGIGVDIARNLKKQGVEFNPDLLIRGVKDGAAGGDLLVPEKDLRPLMRHFQGEVHRKMVTKQRTDGLENKRKADEFLAENKKKEGVQVLPSGVQFKVIKMGTGTQPKDGDIVTVHYRGNLLDGTEFDATPPDQTVDLNLASLIPGWREALKRMPGGSTWQLFIPPEQGYGPRGAGDAIGPNELLQFEVELVGVKTPAAPAPTAPAPADH
ncbi:MAG: FKBP-type peptidyl-prolyl cis-trans isomerase [Methylococcaceae bacterium]|nr:FKBP-type peptidyl-prolyl cis-trans isomerase [Methylococcaceae bacterium]